MVLKVLFAFLLGFIIGAIGVGFLVTSGAANYVIAPVIAANPRVQELESKVREAEEQRTSVARQLERVTDTLDLMGKRFEDLQHRFEGLQRNPGGGSGAAAPGGPASP